MNFTNFSCLTLEPKCPDTSKPKNTSQFSYYQENKKNVKEQNEMKEEIRNSKKPHCITCRKILEKILLSKELKKIN